MRGRRHALALVSGCAVLALAGCGTTVSGADRLSSHGSEGLGVGGPGAGATSSPGATALGGSAGAGGSSTGVNGVGSGASSTSGSGLSAGGGTVDGIGRGVTASTIYLGMVHAQNTDAVNAAAGVGDAALGDPNADTRAVIDYINHNGGVAGRKLQLVEAPFDSASTADVETQWAAVCAKFTQDKPKVFAALDAGTASYRRCLHNAGVVQIDDDLPQASASEFRNYPGFIEVGYPNLDRLV